MADPNTVLLTTSDGQPAAGKPLVLPKNGLALQLELTAGNKLDSANLSLQAAGQDESLTAIFTTDQGAVQGTTWPTQPMNWLIADWGLDRLLTAIQVQLAEKATSGKARLKVYTAGVWIPLYPIDIIATGTEQRFSPVLASKVMVELVKAGDYPGVWLPNPTQVTGVTLKATSQPYDVSIAVADRPAFFQHGSLLPSATPINMEGLVEAVNAYLDEPGHSLPIPLRLQAAIPGKVQITFSATTITETRQLDNTVSDNTLIIPWQEAAVGRITIGNKATLKAIHFTPDFELQPEKLYLAPAAAGASQAQLCASQRRFAQGFHVRLQEAAITDLDLYLYPRSPELEANLSLYPDLHGRPGPAPYGGAVIPIRWQGETSPLGRWLSCQFPQPVRIEDENWWLVFDVNQGETLWALAGDGHGSTYRMVR